MAKKTASKTAKVVKPQSQKPKKGKVVKAAAVEDVDEGALANVKPAKKAAKTVESLVEASKIQKALEQLKKFVSKSQEKEDGKSQLFEDELARDVQLILSKKDLFTSKKSFKPKLIKIEDKPTSETKPSIALLVRDGAIDKDLLEKIEESELNDLISEIITGSELKSTYKPFQKRRELQSKHDIFLSDDALVTNLPKLLGKTFYETSKVPIPVSFGAKFSIQSAVTQVKKVLSSIVYQLPRSNNLSIRLGDIENLNESVVEQVINHFQSEKLRSIFIKTNQSPALPLYELETVYSEEDLKSDEPTNKAVEITSEAVTIEGVSIPENVRLSSFEKGLIELADPEEIPNLIKSRAVKAARASKKKTRQAKKPIAAESDKVSKPLKTKKSAKKSPKTEETTA